MRLPLLLALLGGAFAAAHAQTVTSLRQSGPRATSVNIAFLAEGYTAGTAAQFQADAATKLQALLANDAFARFAGIINADAVFVASAQAGTDIPAQGITRDTYFNSSFGFQGSDRLLTIPPFTPTVTDSAQGTGKAVALLQQTVPDYDIAILLVNTTLYGGSGGVPTVVSLDPVSDDVLLHELGHSFARLADEYVDEASVPFYAPAEYPNATQRTARAEIAWRDFILPATTLPTAATLAHESTVGLFEGSHYRATGFYRPTYDSKMRSLGRPFGPVNLRAFATAVHRLALNGATAAPVITAPPAGATIASTATHTLRVTATGAGPFTYLWRRNGTFLPAATDAELTVFGSDSSTPGQYLVEVTNSAGTTASATATVDVSPAGLPAFTVHPASQSVATGAPATFTATATGSPAPAFQWYRNGLPVTGATGSSLTVASVQPADAGAYAVAATNTFGTVTSREAVLGVAFAGLVSAGGFSDPAWRSLAHPNGRRYTQVLLTGPAATVTADAGHTTRVSYLDLQDDIVQLEFSGAGTMTVTLAGATGPALPLKYAQAQPYMKGHATVVIQGADATTNFAAFSVGRLTAFDPTGGWDLAKPASPTNDPANNRNPIFRTDVTYDGHADLARLVIHSQNGQFGGIFMANAACSDTDGLTGLYAPNVTATGVVRLHDLAALDRAEPVLVFQATANAEDGLRITGGDLDQPNARPVRLAGVARILMSAGTDSQNRFEPARTNRARFQRDGADVTDSVVVPAGP